MLRKWQQKMRNERKIFSLEYSHFLTETVTNQIVKFAFLIKNRNELL